MRLFRATLVASSLSLALLSAAHGDALAQQRVAKVKSKASTSKLVRSQKGFQRDQAKLKNVKATTNLAKLLSSKSSFTGKLSEKASPWTTMKEGKQTFDVSLGRGLKLNVGVGRYDLPMSIGGTRFKLHTLTISKENKSKPLMQGDLPVSLTSGTSYSIQHKRVSWRGPESRFSILAFMHEQGHAHDFGKATEAQHKEFAGVYDRVANQQKLTDVQHRQLIGLERSAWAYALKTARKLKSEGFDVLQGTTTKEIFGTINSSLKGYYEYQGAAP